MKKAFYLIIVVILFSCGNDKDYYEQATKKKSLIERVQDLNMSINDIRKKEKGKLINEQLTSLEYEYKIGDNDTYVITYLFDEVGCYEIGFDGYFGTEENAKLVLDGFKNEITPEIYGVSEEDNQLYRWTKTDKSLTIELDYIDTPKGMAIATIFANE
jgi:hypothetical protein